MKNTLRTFILSVFLILCFAFCAFADEPYAVGDTVKAEHQYSLSDGTKLPADGQVCSIAVPGSAEGVPGAYVFGNTLVMFSSYGLDNLATGVPAGIKNIIIPNGITPELKDGVTTGFTLDYLYVSPSVTTSSGNVVANSTISNVQYESSNTLASSGFKKLFPGCTINNIHLKGSGGKVEIGATEFSDCTIKSATVENGVSLSMSAVCPLSEAVKELEFDNLYIGKKEYLGGANHGLTKVVVNGNFEADLTNCHSLKELWLLGDIPQSSGTVSLPGWARIYAKEGSNAEAVLKDNNISYIPCDENRVPQQKPGFNGTKEFTVNLDKPTVPEITYTLGSGRFASTAVTAVAVDSSTLDSSAYTLNNGILSLSLSECLSKLAEGTHEVSMFFDGTEAAEKVRITITVSDPSGPPVRIGATDYVYTKDNGSGAPIVITFRMNSATNITGAVMNVADIPSSGYEFNVDNGVGTMTIKEDYLKTLSQNKYMLSVFFNDSAGTAIGNISVKVYNSASSIGSPFVTNSGVVSPDKDIILTVDLGQDASAATGVSKIVIGDTEYDDVAAYTFSGITCTVKKSFISGLNLAAGDYPIGVVFDNAAKTRDIGKVILRIPDTSTPDVNVPPTFDGQKVVDIIKGKQLTLTFNLGSATGVTGITYGTAVDSSKYSMDGNKLIIEGEVFQSSDTLIVTFNDVDSTILSFIVNVTEDTPPAVESRAPTQTTTGRVEFNGLDVIVGFDLGTGAAMASGVSKVHIGTTEYSDLSLFTVSTSEIAIPASIFTGLSSGDYEVWLEFTTSASVQKVSLVVTVPKRDDDKPSTGEGDNKPSTEGDGNKPGTGGDVNKPNTGGEDDKPSAGGDNNSNTDDDGFKDGNGGSNITGTTTYHSSDSDSDTTSLPHGFNRDKSLDASSKPYVKKSPGNFSERDGRMVYTFSSGESAVAQWVGDGVNWYFVEIDGTARVGWMQDGDGRWYRLIGKGEAAHGWFQEVDGKWYFLNPIDCSMLTGWQFVDSKYYYMATINDAQNRPLGSMFANETTPDGYRVNESGVWVQ